MASWEGRGFSGTNPTNQDASFEIVFRPDDLIGNHVLLETGGLGDEVTGVFHYSMSLALAEAERRGEAIEHLNKAISLKSAFAAAHYALGKQLEVTKDYPGAIEQYRDALQIEPGMIPAQNNSVKP